MVFFILRCLAGLYVVDAAIASIVIVAVRESAQRPLPPWAPPGYQRPRMRKGVKATLIVMGIIGPVVLLAGFFAAIFGVMYMACDPSKGGC